MLVGGIAGAINPAPSTQFHAQDEFGQFSFGYAGGPSAKTEARNAFGVTTGSYQYVDANGLLQTVNYVADPVNGFRVAGTNLPVAPGAPAAPEVTPLVAPVHTLANVEDTAEVAAAKAEFQAAFDAAAAAAAAAPEERKKREAEPQVVLGGLPYAGLPYAAAALPAAVPALAPVGAVPHVPTVKSDVVTPAEVSHEVSHVAVPAVAPLAVGYYGKRSADAEPEAEADADALYGYYGYPYGYRAYGYGYGYPYRYGYYGKRSADAEPEADADAYYGYYGYPYGYRAYGYGYGYPYRYYGKRSAEADPQVLTYGAGVLPYAAAAYPYVPYVVPAVKPLEIKSEVVATGAAVPVAVGGYKAVAGDNGDLKVTFNCCLKQIFLNKKYF